MQRTPRFRPWRPCAYLPLAVGLAAALAAAPGAAAQVPVSHTLEPAAPVAGDVVYVTLEQEETSCAPEVAAVEVGDDGVRLRLVPTVDFLGEQVYPCSHLGGRSAAFLVPRPGPWRFDVLDADGVLVSGETLDVGGDGEWSRVEVEAEPAAPSALRVRGEGLWPHGGVPTLRGVEIDGQVLRFHLVGLAGGPSVISPWELEQTLRDLPAVLWSVVVDADEPGFRGIRGVDYARSTFCLRDFGDPQLCLHDGRFRVRAWFRLAGGEEQRAEIAELTGESGAFWFFRDDNLELLVKVLDGCAAFDRFWVFASGLTDVGTRIEVTDTWSGESWEHETAPGEGFDEVRDTGAFATCGAVAH